MTFSEAIDFNPDGSGSFTVDDVTISGPAGPITPAGITWLGGNQYAIGFAAQPQRGLYTVKLGPNVADIAGNLMDQDQDGTPGEAGQDVFTSTFAAIDADTIFATSTTISETNTTYDDQDICINATTVAIDGSHDFHSVHLLNGAVLTHSANTATQTHNLDLTVVTEVLVDGTSRIDVNGKGYLAGRTTGNTTTGAATGMSGGSYGGRGGGKSGSPNAVYGDYADPEDWGSGGMGSSGGGLVRISAGELALDGGLRASGGNSNNGGGAGGGISVAVTTLRGVGYISAGGGDGSGEFAGGGGGGGGGRIAVYAQDYSGFNLARITAPGGPGGSGGGAGTVYLRDTDEAYGSLVIDQANSNGGGWTPLGVPGQNTLTVPDEVIVRGAHTNVKAEHVGLVVTILRPVTITQSGHVSMPGESFVPQSALTVSSSALLELTGTTTLPVPLTISGATVMAERVVVPEITVSDSGLLTSFTSSASTMYKLELEVSGTLTVDATSRIDVNGKGYLAGRTTGNTTTGAATGMSGGSYGGRGGGKSGSPNAVYGDYADPEDWGSGGMGSSGGGLVRISAGELALDGGLRASGGNSNNGGGAGGGISVAVTTLRGVGYISAGGGDGSGEFAGGGGGGGGGRIAVYAQDYSGFNLARITAPGGPGGSGGGAGTVLVKQGRLHTHVRYVIPKGLNGGYVDQTLAYVDLYLNNPDRPELVSTG